MTDEAAKVVEGLKHARMSGLYRKYIDPAIALIQVQEATIAERDAEIERLKAENEGLINAYDSIANELASLCNP